MVTMQNYKWNVGKRLSAEENCLCAVVIEILGRETVFANRRL